MQRDTIDGKNSLANSGYIAQIVSIIGLHVILLLTAIERYLVHKLGE